MSHPGGRYRRPACAVLLGWLLAVGIPGLAAAKDGSQSPQGSPAGAVVVSQAQQASQEPTEIKALYKEAGDLYDKGFYGQAAERVERILAWQEKLLGTEHHSIAVSLVNLAKIYIVMARYEQAGSLAKRALAIIEKIKGTEDRETSGVLSVLAEAHKQQFRLREAERLYLRSVAIIQKVDNSSLAIGLNNLALLYLAQGRYGEAETLVKRALAFRERDLGGGHRDVALSLNDLATIYQRQGRYGEAEPLFKRALMIRERALGLEHTDIGVSLNNLALLYVLQDRYEEGEPFYKRALTIFEKVLGPEHPVTGNTLQNLAQLYTFQGHYVEAEPLFKRAIAIDEKALGTEHPDTALDLHNLAMLYANQGRYGEAELLFRRALANWEKALGPEHPSTAHILNRLSLSQLQQRKYPPAQELLKRLTNSQATWLLRELPLQPRELRATQLAAVPDALSTTFALLDVDPAALELALLTRLNRQGLLAEIEQRQRQLADGSPATQDLAERIAGIDRQLASVSLPSEQRPWLRQERQQLEADLYRALPGLRIEPVSTAQVAAALPRDGLLVEFQKYRPYRGFQRGKASWGEPRYVALLLRPDGRSALVPLGEAAPIDAAVVKALAVTAGNNEDPRPLWRQLSRLVLEPLQPHLGGIGQLFLSPDGELHRVPFAALPSAQDPQQLLSEVVGLRILTTGRDLVRLQQPAKAGGAPVVMADPAYGVAAVAAPSTTAGPAGATTAGRQLAQQRSGELGAGTEWNPLPATEVEAQQVAQLLGAGAPIVKDKATAMRALQQKAPRIFHIATHGFFFPVPLPEARGGLGAPELETGRGVSERPAVAAQEDPLLRSGLVLAGANRPELNPADDGYLTAAEATGMDLEGTELVTLSACETGLGDVRSGEGVYGLQRALTVAGARSTLLSLWKVPDAATAAFMAAYYGRLQQGQGRSEALLATQAAFRRDPDPLYRTMYVWAAFQLTGDWRQVQGLASGSAKPAH